MKNFNKNEPSGLLEQIQRVDAPPFLLTRIKQRIADTREQVSPGMAWAAGLCMVFILMLNIYIISGNEHARDHQASSNLAQTMNLFPNNSLYE